MTKCRIIYSLIIFVASVHLSAQESSKLVPNEIIGKQMFYANDLKKAFDGDKSTAYVSYNSTGDWVGLDLGEKHIITQIAFYPQEYYSQNMLLGVFEGANNPDFGDAIPLHLIAEVPDKDNMTELVVDCTKGFRYIRYLGPSGKNCRIAEFDIYGYEGEGDDSKMPQITNLPSVVIHTEGALDIIEKDVYRKGIVSFISEDGQVYTDSLEIKGRGNASWGFPKKPYRLKLYNKTNVLGLPAKEKNWTLISNHGDKTLMRNYLAFDLSERVELTYTPAIKFVNVFLNGEYKGCYQLCDQMEVAEKRIEVENMEVEGTTLPNLSGGYLLEIDAYAYSEVSWFESNKKVPVTVKYPKDDEIVPAQYNYIKEHFNKMEAALFSPEFKDPEKGYRKYMDIESFIRHFLVGEISGNTDTYWSVYMYKKRGDDRFYFGPVWDYDLAYENDRRTYPINTNPNWLYATKGSAANGARAMVNKLFEDPAFVNQLKSIYAQYRDNDVISEDALLAVVNNSAEELEESQKLNFLRWNIMNTIVHENPIIHGSYSAEVENIRRYISGRISWMDKKLEYSATDNSTTSLSLETSHNISVLANNDMIHIKGIETPIMVEIINVEGKILFNEIVNDYSLSLPFAKGFYIVRISDEKQSTSIKCIL